MSVRIDDTKNTNRKHPDPNATRRGVSRGFARSHDGGATTWAFVHLSAVGMSGTKYKMDFQSAILQIMYQPLGTNVLWIHLGMYS